MSVFPRYLLVALLVLVSGLAARAGTVALTASTDATLFEPQPNNNTGGNDRVTAGANSNVKRTRGLIRFNLVGQIPTNASIQAATLTLTVVATPITPVDSTFELRRLLVDWGEGTGTSASGDAGRAAVTGEVTWNNRFHSATPWGAAGASAATDISSTISATRFVQGIGTYTFASTANACRRRQTMAEHALPATSAGCFVPSPKPPAGPCATSLPARRPATGPL